MHQNSRYTLALLCILGAWFPYSIEAQSRKPQLDSLLEVLKKTGNQPTEEVIILRNKIGRLYKQRNLKQALQFAEETLPIAERANSPSNLTNAFALVADLYNLTGDFKMGAFYGDKTAKSMEGLNDSLSLAKKNIVLMSKAGWISSLVAPEERIGYGLKSLEIYTRLKNEAGIANASSELGNAYKNKALYHSKGIAAEDSADFEKARGYFNRAAEYNRKIRNIQQLAYCISLEAMMERQLGFLEKAYRLNRIAIRLYDQEGFLLGAAHPYSEISDIFYAKKRYDSARWYIEKSIALYEQVGYQGNIDEFYSRLSNVYESMGNHKEALAIMKKVNDAREKKYSAETTRSILEIETKYENKLKAEQIRSLMADKLLAEQRISQNRIIFWGSVLFLVLLSGGLFAYLQQRQRMTIQRQSDESQHEKERISQDLHDNIGSQLATVTLCLNRLIRENKVDPSQVSHLRDTLSSTMVELRDTIWAINKQEVSLEELTDKIKNLIWRLSESDSQIKYQLQISGEHLSKKLKPTQAVNAFRILQESIHNSIKHSRASEVIIIIDLQQNERVSINIIDNGTGFDVQSVKSNGNYGLGNMEKRACEIQGEIRIISSHMTGTRILLTFPINETQKLKGKIYTEKSLPTPVPEPNPA